MKRLKIRAGRHNILYLGGGAADVAAIQDVLSESNTGQYLVEWAGTLSEGLDRLRLDVSAVLLDLPLPDSPGLEGLPALVRAFPTTPILVLGNAPDDDLTREVIRAGAQDYLLKRHLDGYWLPRALVSAIERKMAEEALFAETQLAEVTLDSIGDAVLSTDLLGRVWYLNSVAERMTGWSRAEAAGMPHHEVLQIVDALTREPVGPRRGPAPAATDGGHAVSHFVLIRRDGFESAVEDSAALIHDRRGRVIGTVIVFRDMSRINAISVKMSYLANHDPLTDLPNRLLLRDRLARALGLARRHQRGLAVLFLDVDHFKYINDSLGHALGDELLQALARSVAMCVRSSDTVSRQGGDEFVVVLSELEHLEDAALGAQKIIAAVTQPHQVAGHELHVTASVGISVYPGDGEDPETLMKNADLAMYHAKEEGRDQYRFFKPAMNVRAVERQAIETGLRGALKRREFVLHYQPKMNLKTCTIVGGEALIRWYRPNRGLVEPSLFVSIAEECGLIAPIGRWVVHEACRQAQAWQNAGLPAVPISVNISAVEFRSLGFLKSIAAILADTRLDPRFLEIELTERVLMAPTEATSSALRSLKDMGVQLTIDDFGVGYSSLSYLRQYPIDALKVDRSFVQEITSTPNGGAIVRAVIGMGRSLHHRVIAEGVETEEQLAFLQSEGCGEGQGYYFSPPLAAEQFAEVLGAGTTQWLS